jgi:hypothetical protein
MKHVSVQAMGEYGILEVHIHVFLMPTLNGDECSVLLSGHVTAGSTERAQKETAISSDSQAECQEALEK